MKHHHHPYFWFGMLSIFFLVISTHQAHTKPKEAQLGIHATVLPATAIPEGADEKFFIWQRSCCVGKTIQITQRYRPHRRCQEMDKKGQLNSQDCHKYF